MNATKLCDDLAAAVKVGNRRHAVFLVMEKVDEALLAGEFAAVRNLLETMTARVGDFDTYVLHAMLAITFAADRHLQPMRQTFFRAVIPAFREKYSPDEVRRLLGSLGRGL